MNDGNGQGWLTLKRKPRQVVLIEVPAGPARLIRVAVGEPDRGTIPLSIQADRDIEITREEKDEATED